MISVKNANAFDLERHWVNICPFSVPSAENVVCRPYSNVSDLK